jgi:hypothetical protein
MPTEHPGSISFVGRPLSQMHALPMNYTSRCWSQIAGKRWRQPVRMPSASSGRRLGSKTGHSAIRVMSPMSWHPDTVNTMPEATLAAVADHGVIRHDAVRGRYGAARETLEALKRLGVDIEKVANTLEEQGIASFAKSWDELIVSVTRQIERAGAVVMPGGAVKPRAGESSRDAAPAAGAPRASAMGETDPVVQEIYRSCNGDRWQLVRDGSGRRFVRHQANASAGGQVTDTAVDEFLRIPGTGSEKEELRRILLGEEKRLAT